MITGDHAATAMAIARDLGILREGDTVLTGRELDQMDDEELKEVVRSCSVYARVSPEHKVRIVKAWQSWQEIVAMTGDGVNDAPALKRADIGAAMGIVGTEVAKEASDMVLTDDNFATIVAAVEEGRVIFSNIIKSIQFLLSCNVGEILVLFIATILNWATPLLPIHILWVNLVTDSLPGLEVDPAETGIMERKPRDPKSRIFSKGMVRRIVYQGIMVGGLTLAAFPERLPRRPDHRPDHGFRGAGPLPAGPLLQRPIQPALHSGSVSLATRSSWGPSASPPFCRFP